MDEKQASWVSQCTTMGRWMATTSDNKCTRMRTTASWITKHKHLGLRHVKGMFFLVFILYILLTILQVHLQLVYVYHHNQMTWTTRWWWYRDTKGAQTTKLCFVVCALGLRCICNVSWATCMCFFLYSRCVYYLLVSWYVFIFYLYFILLLIITSRLIETTAMRKF